MPTETADRPKSRPGGTTERMGSLNRRTLDLLTLIGLAVSLAAVCDMLGHFGGNAMQIVYYVWGVACAGSVALILLSPKARDRFHETCRGGSPLLVLRLVVSVLIFVLGWYVNAASTSLYGADSEMVAGNGARMFAVVFTMVVHVFYLGFTRKKQ